MKRWKLPVGSVLVDDDNGRYVYYADAQEAIRQTRKEAADKVRAWLNRAKNIAMDDDWVISELRNVADAIERGEDGK